MKKRSILTALFPALFLALFSFAASAESVLNPNTGDKGFPVGIIIALVVCILLVFATVIWYIFMQNKKK